MKDENKNTKKETEDTNESKAWQINGEREQNKEENTKDKDA